MAQVSTNAQTLTPQQRAALNNVNNISIKDIFYICLSRWPWFVLSVLVCLAVAVAYILRTPKSYTRMTSIVIKDDGKGKSIGTDVAQAFSDMGIGASNTNINNELLTIQSNDAAISVVKRLALNVNYSKDGTFHDVALYGTTLPVKVDFPGASDDEGISFDIDFNKNGQYTLSHFTHNGAEVEGTVTGRPGYNMVHTPVGRLVILRTRYYNPSTTSSTIHVYRGSVEGAKGSLMGRFTAALGDKNATVINMTFTDVCPQRAEDVLRTIISVYNENWVKDKNQIAVSTSQFINERLKVIEKELGSVDNSISSYKSANGITDIAANSAVYLQQSTAADAQMLNLNNQIYMAKYIRSYLSNKKNNNQLLPANAGIENDNISTQINEYNSMLLQRNNIVANSSEKNPIAVDLETQLTAMRSALIHSMDNIILTLQTQLNSQQSYAGQASQKIASNPNQARHLLSDERQQKVKEALYLFLLQKREENELSQAFTAYNTRIVNSPNGPMGPTAPVSSKILLIALAIGFGLPLAIIYLLEMQNTKVRSKADLDDKISIPYLGEIPTYLDNIQPKKWQFWKKKHEKKDIVVREGSRGVLNEAFRIVGTNIEFMKGKNNESGNIYMVTSYNQGSGKSFITGNIGAVLAVKKKRVLIIDGDLRHASVSAIVDRPKQGLSDYLSGNIDNIDDVIVKGVKFPLLDILPVGTIPPNPSELLGSEEFGKLLQDIHTRYDYVIVDCPPADMMADATIVSKYANHTLFIIRAGLFERKMLSLLDEDYKSGKFNNMSVILNSTFGVGGRYGYGYGYRYGYGYGYHYGYHYGYGYGNEKD